MGYRKMYIFYCFTVYGCD